MSRKIVILLALLVAFSAFGLGSADLQVELDAPPAARPGETYRVTATLFNAGPTAAEDVQFRLEIRDHVCYDQVNLGTIEAGERRVFECSAELPVGEYAYYIVYSGVSAWSETTGDFASYNNSASRYADLITPPDLVPQIIGPGPVKPGLPFTATVHYANIARVPTERAILTITVPTRFGNVPEFCTVEGNRARCDVGPVTADEIPQWKHFPIEIYAPDASELEFEVAVDGEVAEGDAGPSNDHSVARPQTYRTFYVTDTESSLANAIHAANASCVDQRPCLIAFRIPVEAPRRITWVLREPLPAITASYVTLDATTQAGYYGEIDGPEIELQGHELADGLGIVMPSACFSAIRGFALKGFRTAAIAVGTEATCPSPYYQPFRFVEQNELTGNTVGLHVDGTRWLVSGNLVAGNARAGVRVESGVNRLLQNVIRDNGASGVFIAALATGTDIDENEITRNGHAGIAIAGDAQNVAVNGNSIYANGGLAIDWGIDGVSPEVPVPAPVITAVYFEDGFTVIEGILGKVGGTLTPRVQLYASDEADPHGHGEGQQFLGMTQPLDREHFRLLHPGDLRGKWISGTSTRVDYYGWLRTPRPLGDTGYGMYTTTSEFGRAVQVH